MYRIVPIIILILAIILFFSYNKENMENVGCCTGSPIPFFRNNKRELRFYDIATYDF